MPSTTQNCETENVIQILHPGIDLEEPFEKTLIQSNCNLGETEYYMDVESVVCGDSQCRIDTVRLFWDELGFFKKFELPYGVELEKAEGTSFTEEDYVKLNTILSDRNSNLKYVDKYEVTGSETSEGVDALAGATIALDVNSYVKGAVWTCYTLWHWTNGNIYNEIRNITGTKKTQEDLIKMLHGSDLKNKQFALEQILRRKHQDANTTREVMNLVSLQNKKLNKGIAKYISILSPNDFFKTIGVLTTTKNTRTTLFALRVLSESDKTLPQEFLQELSKNVVHWDSYEQVNLFFSILEKNKIDSKKINGTLLPLLEAENFLIGRRTFWYLSERNLPLEGKKTVMAFYDKNAKKL